MEITYCNKIKKFIQLLSSLASHLEGRKELTIHNHVNQFYYMTKAEELRILMIQYEEQTKRLDMLRGQIQLNYKETFHHWRKDVRWLNTYFQQRQDSSVRY